MSRQNGQSEPTQPQRGGGCIRSLLMGVLLVLALIGAVGIGVVLADIYDETRAIQTAIDNPLQAVMKKIGLEATPVIRPDPVVVINDITRMAQLQTAEISMTEVFTAQAGTEEFFGLFEDSLIFVAVGQVTAGIDLAKLTPNDLEVSSFQTATIRLPQPELFVVTLDNEQSRVMDRDTGLLMESDPQLETLVRQAAVQNFEAEAIEQGILDEATLGAQEALGGLLTSLGFENVVFIGIDDALPAPLPDPELPKGYFVTPNP